MAEKKDKEKKDKKDKRGKEDSGREWAALKAKGRL